MIWLVHKISELKNAKNSQVLIKINKILGVDSDE